MTLDGVTVTGNTATGGSGGGLYAEGFASKNVSVKGSTIASNSAGNGSNVYFNAGDSALTFQNTIIANPIGSTNCERANGDFTSLGHNLDSGALGVPTDSNVCFEGTAAQGDQNGVSPQLGPLQDNGGQTMTMAPGINSPAVDKGIAAGDLIDQRGLPRTFDMGHSIAAGGDGTDIGAFEQTILKSPDEPAQIQFDPQRWGTASGNQAVSLLNRTGSPITPGTLAFTGIDSSDFQLNSDTCSNTALANNFSCGVNAVFHPVSAGGALSASLDIPTNVSPTQSISVSGTSTEYISLVPSPKDYGSTQVGSPTATTQFTVENAGSAMSGTLAVALTGANASEFGITGEDCGGTTLPDHGTCTISVRFAPTSAGAKTASLSVTGTPGGTQTSALTGTATALTPPPPPPSTSTGPTGQRAAALKKCKKKSAQARTKCKKKAKQAAGLAQVSQFASSLRITASESLTASPTVP